MLDRKWSIAINADKDGYNFECNGVSLIEMSVAFSAMAQVARDEYLNELTDEQKESFIEMTMEVVRDTFEGEVRVAVRDHDSSNVVAGNC